MKIISRITNLIVVGSLLSATGCVVGAIPPDLDEKKPVEMHEHWYGTELEQNKKAVNLGEAVSKFRQIPEAEAAAYNQKFYFWGAVGTGFIGGALVGWSIGDFKARDQDRLALALTGVGFIGLSLASSYISDHYLRKAAAIYNQKFDSKSKKSRAELYPFVTPVAEGGVMGLKYSF